MEELHLTDAPHGIYAITRPRSTTVYLVDLRHPPAVEVFRARAYPESAPAPGDWSWCTLLSLVSDRPGDPAGGIADVVRIGAAHRWEWDPGPTSPVTGWTITGEAGAIDQVTPAEAARLIIETHTVAMEAGAVGDGEFDRVGMLHHLGVAEDDLAD